MSPSLEVNRSDSALADTHDATRHPGRRQASRLYMRLFVTPNKELVHGNHTFRCALGPAGLLADKREGDGGTPIGVFPLRRALYRADRMEPPQTGLRLEALQPNDGWCDAPDDPNYNRAVKLPYPASTESLWRDDSVYDIIVILGHNDDPPEPGMGSAVFFHLARDGYPSTEGCVAVSLPDMLAVLADCDSNTVMKIGGGANETLSG